METNRASVLSNQFVSPQAILETASARKDENLVAVHNGKKLVPELGTGARHGDIEAQRSTPI